MTWFGIVYVEYREVSYRLPRVHKDNLFNGPVTAYCITETDITGESTLYN